MTTELHHLSRRAGTIAADIGRLNADALLTEKQVATLFAVSVEKLRRDRRLGRGLPTVHLGTLVRYRVSSVRAWLEEQERIALEQRQRRRN